MNVSQIKTKVNYMYHLHRLIQMSYNCLTLDSPYETIETVHLSIPNTKVGLKKA
jgi:hypothetical protein